MEHGNCPTNVADLLPLPAFEHGPVCVDECSKCGAACCATDVLPWTRTNLRCEEWEGFASEAVGATVEYLRTELGDDSNMCFGIFSLNWAMRHADGKIGALRDHPCTASS